MAELTAPGGHDIPAREGQASRLETSDAKAVTTQFMGDLMPLMQRLSQPRLWVTPRPPPSLGVPLGLHPVP